MARLPVAKYPVRIIELEVVHFEPPGIELVVSRRSCVHVLGPRQQTQSDQNARRPHTSSIVSRMALNSRMARDRSLFHHDP